MEIDVLVTVLENLFSTPLKRKPTLTLVNVDLYPIQHQLVAARLSSLVDDQTMKLEETGHLRK